MEKISISELPNEWRSKLPHAGGLYGEALKDCADDLDAAIAAVPDVQELNFAYWRENEKDGLDMMADVREAILGKPSPPDPFTAWHAKHGGTREAFEEARKA